MRSRVEQAWTAGSFELALGAAVDAWRAGHAPEQALVARAIAAEALVAFEAPPARTQEEFQKAWLAASRRGDGLTTAWLASTLTRLLPIEADYFGLLREDYAQTKYAALFARLEALRQREPHPCLAAALAAVLAEAPFSTGTVSSAGELYQPMLELLVASGDVSQLPVLEALERAPRAPRATIRDYLRTALPPAIQALRQVKITLDPEERAAWARLLERLAPARPGLEGGEALLEQVLRVPGLDEPRLVYADWLSERGDPRGEFIALQLAKGDEAAARRASALLRAHQGAWLGALDGVLTHVSFVRGFLDGCALAQNASATEAGWEAAARSPVLRTVRFLEKGRGNAAHYEAFVCSPARPPLLVVELPAWSLLSALLEGPPRSVETLVLYRPPRLRQLRALADGRARLPALKRLIVIASAPHAAAAGLEARALEEDLLTVGLGSLALSFAPSPTRAVELARAS
jgi:uncharacterized protein (TIGR02996 family)